MIEEENSPQRFEINDQIRRASLSIVLNIAEGYGKASTKDFKRFLSMSIGSANELQVLIEIIKDLGYLETKIANKLIQETNEIGKMLYTLRKNWQEF